MKNLLNLLIFFSFYGFASLAACLNGIEADKTFHNQIMSSKERLSQEFIKVNRVFNTEAQIGCELCVAQIMPDISKKISTMKIPNECIVGALKRSIQQQAIVCKNEIPTKKTNLSADDYPCITNELSNYLTYASNKVLSCFNNIPFKSGKSLYIRSKTIFEKINNESGFNFSASSSGGIGIGQLTTSAVAEMNFNIKSGTNGNGRYILDAILDSKYSDCESLKEFIINDKKLKLSNPRDPVCEWISVDRGAVKNLIYSVGYFAYFKDQLMLEMQRVNTTVDDTYLDKMALISYYSGPEKGKAYLRDWKRSVTDLNKIKVKIDNEFYIKAIKEKFFEAINGAAGLCQFL